MVRTLVIDGDDAYRVTDISTPSQFGVLLEFILSRIRQMLHGKLGLDPRRTLP